MARHVTALTATAVANNLSRVCDDDIVVVNEFDSSIYIASSYNIDGVTDQW